MKRQHILATFLAIVVIVLVTTLVQRPKSEQWLWCLGEELDLTWEAQQNGDMVDIIITIYNPQETWIHYELGLSAIWGSKEGYRSATLEGAAHSGPYELPWRTVPPREDLKFIYRFDDQLMQFDLELAEGFGSCENYQYVRTWTP